MELLRKQTEQNRTIIFSIHQPRYAIFKLFDQVTLLSQGHLVYAGARDGVIDYFTKMGYPCEMYGCSHQILIIDNKRMLVWWKAMISIIFWSIMITDVKNVKNVDLCF